MGASCCVPARHFAVVCPSRSTKRGANQPWQGLAGRAVFLAAGGKGVQRALSQSVALVVVVVVAVAVVVVAYGGTGQTRIRRFIAATHTGGTMKHLWVRERWIRGVFLDRGFKVLAGTIPRTIALTQWGASKFDRVVRAWHSVGAQGHRQSDPVQPSVRMGGSGPGHRHATPASSRMVCEHFLHVCGLHACVSLGEFAACACSAAPRNPACSVCVVVCARCSPLRTFGAGQLRGRLLCAAVRLLSEQGSQRRGTRPVDERLPKSEVGRRECGVGHFIALERFRAPAWMAQVSVTFKASNRMEGLWSFLNTQGMSNVLYGSMRKALLKQHERGSVNDASGRYLGDRHIVVLYALSHLPNEPLRQGFLVATRGDSVNYEEKWGVLARLHVRVWNCGDTM